MMSPSMCGDVGCALSLSPSWEREAKRSLDYWPVYANRKDMSTKIGQAATRVSQLRWWAETNPTHESSRRNRSQRVRFRGEDKVAFGEAVDLVREDGNLDASPAEADVRVVSLFFGHLADTIDELQRLAKIFERVGLDEVMLTDDLPAV